MRIFWHGQACFKILGKDVILITDPFHKKIGLVPPRIKADIVTVSHNHPSHSNVASVRGNPKVIFGPGEYEIKKVNISGISTFHDRQEGKKLGLNTVYVIEIEDIKICHLGDIGHVLTDAQLDQINGVDILMIPTGQTNQISIKEAIQIINEIEPKIVIPMHYKIPGLKATLSSLNKFCDEMGLGKKEVWDKLRIKKKDLPKEETKVVILKQQ